MLGLAGKLWNERQGRKELKAARWPRIVELIEKGMLHPIDEAFAAALLKSYRIVEEEPALFLCFLLMAAREGHLCVKAGSDGIEPMSDEWKEAAPLILQGALQLPKELKGEAGAIVLQDGLYYLKRNWIKETACLEHIRRLLDSSPSMMPDLVQMQAKLEELLISGALLPEQAQAIRAAGANALCLLTGGPGTGKTYTAGHMIRLLWEGMNPKQQQSYEIALAAPTGKAAANLKKSLVKAMQGLPIAEKLNAQTLHALLGIRKSHARENTLLTADLILVDESSMIDTFIMARLLQAVKPGARLILLGDPCQLPSVEVGSVFANLVEAVGGSRTYQGQCVELSRCMRADLKGIVDFASAIKKGALELPLNYEGIARLDAEIYLSQPKKFVDVAVKQFLAEGYDSFRILSPMRRGPWGVDALNQLFYAHLARSSERSGIPIMIIQNDERTGLFNGETGLLYTDKNVYEGDFGPFDRAIFEGREIPALLLPKFELAYCMSVHKSQGSEFAHIIVLLPEGSEVFGREVFYTAITRARKSAALVANDSTLLQTVARRSLRLSGFPQRLAEAFG